MAIRVLIINRQLVAAVTIKQALEQTGVFVVRPFTTADTAFDFLRDHPQDVAVIDFNLPGRSGAKVVQQIRNLQPDIAVIISPRQPEADIAHLNINGMVNVPYTARDIIPLIEKALNTTISYPGQTRRLGEDAPASGQMTTRNLSKKGEAPPPSSTQFGKTMPLNPQEQENSLQGATSVLPEIPPAMTTRILDEDRIDLKQTPRVVQQPPPEPEWVENLPQTRILDDKPSAPARMPWEDKPAQTHILDDQTSVPARMPWEDEPAQTHILDDQTSVPARMPWEDEPAQTHILGDIPPTPPRAIEPSQTRRLDPSEVEPSIESTHQLDDDLLNNWSMPGTRLFTNESDNIEGSPPVQPAGAEFTPLEDVLRSFGLDIDESEVPPPFDDSTEYEPPLEDLLGGYRRVPAVEPAAETDTLFEPPVAEGDTPAVPTQDSDALRQFLATSESKEEVDRFDNVLGSINADDLQPKRKQQVDFEGLVRSLSGEKQPHRPLPSRQQDSLDFVLSSGMESVLREIEKTKTGPLGKKPESLPEQPKEVKPPASRIKPLEAPPAPNPLADEEPPMPTFAESGTVSDLLVGVSDSSFRSVIALLGGEEPPQEAPVESAPAIDDDPFADFFKPDIEPQEIPFEQAGPKPIPSVTRRVQPVPSTAQNFDFESLAAAEPPLDEEASVASVVLQTALNERAVSGFSIDNLLADIEERLTEHQIRIRPLPSWDMDTSAFRAIVDAANPKPASRKPNTLPESEISEPSFLPRVLPPGQIIPPILPEFDSEEIYSDATTRAAASVYDALQSMSGDGETRVDSAAVEHESEELSWMADLIKVTEVSAEPSVEPEWLPEHPELDQPQSKTPVPADWLPEHPDLDVPGQVLPAEPAHWLPEHEEAVADAPVMQDTIGDWFEDEFEETPPVAEEAIADDVPPASSVVIPALEDIDFDAAFGELPELELELPPPANDFADALEALLKAQQSEETTDDSPLYAEAESEAGALLASLMDTTPISAHSAWDEPLVIEPDASSETESEPPSIPTEEETGSTAPAFLDEWATPAEWTPSSQLVTAFTDDWAASPEENIPEQEEQTPAPAPVDDWTLPAADTAAMVKADDWNLPAPTAAAEALPTLEPEDAYLAQLALHLTQMSLEISAEATLLTREEEMVAYAGHLSKADAQELRRTINDDWRADPEGARLRFITLPSSGKEYMLYSTQTVGDLVLSLIFAGTTPIRTIRQQGQRLLDALAAIPEIQEEQEPAQEAARADLTAAPTADVSASLEAFTYLWLLRDPNHGLSADVGEAIVAGLKTQLRERRWNVHQVQVSEDYVYMQAEVPADLPSNQVIRDLKTRSAEIAHAQNPDLTPQLLWADGYLILTPGRELSVEEIQEFINFQRMM